ncbi:MAG: hypothetical protein ACRDRU_11100 [Pseudonocardiaceae bacterium]
MFMLTSPEQGERRVGRNPALTVTRTHDDPWTLDPKVRWVTKRIVEMYGDVAGLADVETEGTQHEYVFNSEVQHYMGKRRAMLQRWKLKMQERASVSQDLIAQWNRGTPRYLGEVYRVTSCDEYQAPPFAHRQGFEGRNADHSTRMNRESYDDEYLVQWLRDRVPWKSLAAVTVSTDRGPCYATFPYIMYNDRYHANKIIAFYAYMIVYDDAECPKAMRIDGWADEITEEGLDRIAAETWLQEDGTPAGAFEFALWSYTGITDAERYTGRLDNQTSAEWGLLDYDGSLDAHLYWRILQFNASMYAASLQTFAAPGKPVSARAHCVVQEVTGLFNDHFGYARERILHETSNLLFYLAPGVSLQDALWKMRVRVCLLEGVYAKVWHTTLQDAEACLLARSLMANIIASSCYGCLGLIANYCSRRAAPAAIRADLLRYEARLVDLLEITRSPATHPATRRQDVLAEAVSHALSWFAVDPPAMTGADPIKHVAASVAGGRETVCAGQDILLSAGLWANIRSAYGGSTCVREWIARAEQFGQACDTWVRHVLEGARDHKIIGCLSTEIRRAGEDARRPPCECGLTICRGAALYESTVCAWTEFGPFTTLLELAEVFLESEGYAWP